MILPIDYIEKKSSDYERKTYMKDYIKIARPEHWVKNFFVLPGTALAMLLITNTISGELLFRVLVGLLATCFIASANYVINEWLDAGTDQYHPTKKKRPVVSGNIKGKFVIVEYIILIILGLGLSALINKPFLYTEIWLLVMGVLYNVKPIRTKDIVYLDVITESINNMIRLLLGWFMVTWTILPPSSILLGYWMAGAFLMATKRFAEFRMINDPQLAGNYRKSFKYYTERTLMASSLFYALGSTFCIGVFLVKYRIEYLVAVPFMFALFIYYFIMAFDFDSAVQKPEKLYKERKLMALVLALIAVLILMTFIDVPFLSALTSTQYIAIG